MARISLTEAARQQLISYMEKHDLNVIRLSVRRTGCSGWQCSFEHFVGDTSTMASTPVIEGRHIVVSEADMFITDGITVDYERKNLSHQFTFKTQIAQAYCGCGESFTI